MEYDWQSEQAVQTVSIPADCHNREYMLRARMCALQEAMSDLCWMTTIDGHIQEQQTSWERFVGQNQKQAAGKGWLEALHPEDRPLLEDTLAQCAHTGQPGNSICLVRDAEGYYRCLSIQSIPVLDKENHVQEVLCLGTPLMPDQQQHRSWQNWTKIIHLQALLIDTTFDSIVLRDYSGRILAWNQGATDLHGYSEQEVIGQQTLDLFQTYYPNTLSEEILMQALLNDGRWEGELKHVYRDGRQIIVESRLIMIRSEEGQPQAILQISHDVTAQKRTEEQLKASIELVQMAGKIGLWTADIAQDQIIFTSWDKTIFPDSPQSPCSVAEFLDIVHPDEREITAEALHNTLEYQKDYIAEFRMSDAAQQYQWYTSYGRLIYDEQGKPAHLVGITLNITERKQTEQALQEANEQITTILESVNDSFLSVNKEWRYTYVNTQTCRNLGKSRDELLGQVIWDVHPNHRNTIVAQKYRETMDERKCTTFDFFFEQTERWFTIRTYPAKDGITVFITDITERVHMEETLRKNAIRFSRLVEANISGVVIANSEGKIIEANDTFLTMTDSTREELEHGEIDWEILTPPEYHQADLHAIQELQETGVFIPYEKEYVTKRGKRIPILLIGTNLETESHVKQHIAFTIDLTKQKEIEKQREQFLRLINLAHDAILIRDSEGHILSWNEGAERLYGWTAQETLGQITHSLLQTQFPVSLKAVEHSLETCGQWEGELIHTCCDGRRVIVESRHVLTRDEQGRSTAILEINRDVTEQRRLEQQEQARLAEKDARLNVLQLILDRLSTGIFLVQGPHLRLLMANQAVTTIMGNEWQRGQSREEFLTRYNIGFFSMDGQELTLMSSPVGRALMTGEPVLRQELIIRQPDGTRLPVLLDAIPLEHLHEFSLLPQEIATVFTPAEQVVLVVCHNVAALKEAEALKDQFVSLATHELRTPVTIIAGYADRLIVHADRGRNHHLDEWQREKVQEIKQASWQLAGLTEDLLDVTRMQAGQLRLELCTTDLVAITQQVINQLQVTTDRHQLNFHTTATQLQATVDAFRIKQVLSNLLSNAIKYSPGGGPIDVTLEAHHQTQETHFRIRDQGMGIPRSQQGDLFEKFVRADNARTAGIRGTGLGLYLCRELIERHGGNISFESQEGSGSTFFIVLPLIALTKN